jgi:tripartite-type tricarboxylate transporter receptor subunit TctC
MIRFLGGGENDKRPFCSVRRCVSDVQCSTRAGLSNRPFKFVVPFPPGGNLDFVTRTLQPKMQEVLGQPVIIDNRGGNAGMIGLEYAAKQPGRRLHHRAWQHRHHRHQPSRSTQDELRPVKDFVADRHHHHQRAAGDHRRQRAGEQHQGVRRLCQGQSRQAQFAISGAGSGPHFGAEMFKRAAGLDIPVIFYKGSGPVLTDLLGGQVQITMDARLGDHAPRSRRAS